ncbi:MAG: hypothetical protein JSW11_05100 [Candidatus Heimdallarchaeota archaeon]|nr:MAG: hypothetical protein JSW11_05100 [Candidatus Heimdallarchaeota archaeon]
MFDKQDYLDEITTLLEIIPEHEKGIINEYIKNELYTVLKILGFIDESLERDPSLFSLYIRDVKKAIQEPDCEIFNFLPPREKKIVLKYMQKEKCSFLLAIKLWYTNYLGYPSDILKSGSYEFQKFLEELKKGYIEWIKGQKWIHNPERLINSIKMEFSRISKKP